MGSKLREFTLLLAAFCVVPVLGNASNLLTNGNFETGTFSGWHASGDVGVVGHGGLEPFWFGAGNSFQDGSYVVAFNAGDLAPNGVIYQSFATIAGDPYIVHFDFGLTQVIGGLQHIIVTASDGSAPGGTVLANVTASTGDTNCHCSVPLSTFGFGFTAASSVSTLTFTDDTMNNTISEDGVLDNVSVSGPAVPEPASLALLASGLLGLPALRRRKSENEIA